MLKIEGDRIILRDHKVEDLMVMHAWMADPEIMHFLPWRTTRLEETFQRLAECLDANAKAERTRYYFAIELKETPCVIGEAGFTLEGRVQEGGAAEMGYFLLRPYWGQGYATEAARLMIAFCFDFLGLHKVTAQCDAGNEASEKVMIRCGMQREAYRRKHQFRDGEWRDRLEYAILSEDINK